MQQHALTKAIRDGRPAALIVNTHSRFGVALLRRAEAGLVQRGVRVAEAYAIHHPSVLREAIHALISRDYRLIAVAGGDGTVTSIAGEFAYRDVALGLIPSGTGNSFARTMGIPTSLDGALDVIATGKVATIDLGKVGEWYFANVSTVGISVIASQLTPRVLKRFIGPAAYVLAGACKLFFIGHRPFTCQIEVDGKAQTILTHELVIANGRYFGDSLVTPDASVTNQRLVLCAMTPLNRFHFAGLWYCLLRERKATLPGIELTTGRQITITTDPVQSLSLDGETIGSTPAQFSIAPKALHVLVPGE